MGKPIRSFKSPVKSEVWFLRFIVLRFGDADRTDAGDDFVGKTFFFWARVARSRDSFALESRMLEMGLSGLMSGEGKQPAASRSRSSALPRLYRS